MIDDCFFVINWAREELLAWLSRVWTYLNTSAIIRTTAEKLCWFGFKRYYENVYLLDVSSNELIWQVTIKFCSLLISAICWFDILRSASDWKGNDDWDFLSIDPIWWLIDVLEHSSPFGTKNCKILICWDVIPFVLIWKAMNLQYTTSYPFLQWFLVITDPV